jgi:hypothetical protein
VGEGVIVVLVALIAGVLGPCVLALLTGQQRRAEKKEDYARQDLVAAKAERAADRAREAAEAVAEQAAAAAELLLEQNHRVARTAEATQDQLKVIHGLVNSSLTSAMENELKALEGQLSLLRERPQAAVVQIAETAGKVDELRARLNDRRQQAEQAAGDVADARASNNVSQQGPGE